MKFGLKDLFWSLSLACLGMADIYFLLSGGPWGRHEPRASFVVIFSLLLCSPGLLFGAAAGQLYHRAKTGALVGFLLWIALIVLIVSRLRWQE
jgi:hypothetical protein